ncbi:MAG: ChbG/HpnK family deacetylase [Bacteroidales bacterium]|nr:ChbG/HpnK family deacetylase [Bacteroidales bacterium]
MKKLLFAIAVLICVSLSTQAQRLIVRTDDIGGAQAMNEAVIYTYTDGIARSAEVMVVGPWFPQAVKMLNANPGLDVGVHVVLTSEWENYKWRPMTECPTLCDEFGYFLRGTFPSDAYPNSSMMERVKEINLAEVEAEVRAQIALAVKLIPNVTHISGHMAWSFVSREIAEIGNKVAAEFGLPYIDSFTHGGLNYEGLQFGMGVPVEERAAKFIEALSKMEPGKTYMTIDHPAFDTPEIRALGHIGYEGVAIDRQAVTDLYTNPDVKKYIADHGIELVSFGDLIREGNK